MTADEARLQHEAVVAAQQAQAPEIPEAQVSAEATAQEPRAKRTYRKNKTFHVKVPREHKVLNFTCNELIRLFGGWFTLTYAFSQPNGRVNSNGTEGETDYYICSRDVSAIPPSLRPEKNIAIKNLFNKDVYGMAIIAPSSAFGGGRDEDYLD